MNNENQTMQEWNLPLPTEAMNPVEALQRYTLHPQVMSAVGKMCKLLADSAMVPKLYQGSPANVFVALQAGATLGFQPLQSLQSIAVINGTPSLFGDGLMALLLRHGVDVHEDVPTEWSTRAVATCTMTRRGLSRPVVRTFSYEDAKRANLIGKTGPWQTNPLRMLQMRARSFAARDCAADILRGLAVFEEQADVERSQVSTLRTQPSAKPREEEPVRVMRADTLAPAQQPDANAPTFTSKIKRPPKGAQPGDTWHCEGDGQTRVLSPEGVWLNVHDDATTQQPTSEDTVATDIAATVGASRAGVHIGSDEPSPGLRVLYWVKVGADYDATPGALFEAFVANSQDEWEPCKPTHEVDLITALARQVASKCKQRDMDKDWLLDEIEEVFGRRVQGLSELSPRELTFLVGWVEPRGAME